MAASLAKAEKNWRSNSKRRATTGLRRLRHKPRVGLISMSTEVSKQESSHWEALYLQQGEIAAPGWASRLRESAFDRFREIGFPSVKEEEWKYTNVAPVTKVNFSPVTPHDNAVTAADVTRLGCVEAQDSQLVFVNGVLRRDLSSLNELPPGVIAIDLAEAMSSEQHQDQIREYFARG